MNKKLINYLGLLGIIGFISYVVAMLYAPIAYPNYNWMSQAVSDLSAKDAPSRELWNQLTVLYRNCGIVSITLVAVFIEEKLTKTLRIGIYLFAVMNWISFIGYELFPLTTSGYNGTFQDIMHTYVVTLTVVLLSILSLACIIIGGFREKKYRTLAVWAVWSLFFMLAGAVGTGIVAPTYFGIPERFSVLSATFFNAVLGVYLFKGFTFESKE